MRHKSRLTFKTWRVIISPLLLIFALLLFVGPVAAQTPTPRAGNTTSTQNFTDTPADIVKGLGTQGYYISQSAKANIKESNLEQTISSTVSKLKGDKHDTRIVVAGNQILSAAPQSNGGNPADYARFLQGYLSNPQPESVIVVNAEKQTVGLYSSKLTTAEAQKLIDDNRSVF